MTEPPTGSSGETQPQTQIQTQAQTAQAPEVVVKPTGKKDGWSDWDEELVDPTDVNGAQAAKPSQPATTSNITEVVNGVASPVPESQPSSQDAGAPRFLSTTAVAGHKPAAPAAPPAATPSQPVARRGVSGNPIAAD